MPPKNIKKYPKPTQQNPYEEIDRLMQEMTSIKDSATEETKIALVKEIFSQIAQRGNDRDIQFINSSFIQAAKIGDIDMVKFFLTKGADINAKDALDKTALDYASENSLHVILDILSLKEKAQKTTPPNSQISETSIIANEQKDNNDNEKSNQLSNPDGPIDYYGKKTLLQLSAKVASIIYKTLVDKKELLTSERKTFGLYFTALDKNDLIKILANKLQFAATQDIRILEDQYKLAAKQMFENAQTLHQQELLNRRLLKAHQTESNELNLIKKLIEQGADVNTRDQDGGTVLMYAASKHQIAIAKLLIENGANVNLATNQGITALMWAAAEGDEHIVNLLINHGADVNAKDHDSNSVSQKAFERKHDNIVSLLKKHTKKLDIISENILKLEQKPGSLKAKTYEELLQDLNKFNENNIIEALTKKLQNQQIGIDLTADNNLSNLAKDILTKVKTPPLNSSAIEPIQDYELDAPKVSKKNKKAQHKQKAKEEEKLSQQNDSNEDQESDDLFQDEAIIISRELPYELNSGPPEEPFALINSIPAITPDNFSKEEEKLLIGELLKEPEIEPDNISKEEAEQASAAIISITPDNTLRDLEALLIGKLLYEDVFN